MPHERSRRFGLVSLAAGLAVVVGALTLLPAVPTDAARDEAPAPPAPPVPPSPAALAPPAPPAQPAPPAPPARRSERRRERDEEGRAWLGVVLTGRDGARVGEVLEGSPAAEAGVREGDRIVEFDGQEIEYGRDIFRAMRSLSPGQQVRIRVERDGEERSLDVTLGERDEEVHREIHKHKERILGPREDREDDGGEDVDELIIPGRSRRLLGVEILHMSEELRAGLKAPRDRGVLVNKVVDASPAEEAGVRAGDVIVSVDGQAVRHAGDIGRALRERAAGDSVPVTVIRDGVERTLDVTVSERPGLRGRRGLLHIPELEGDLLGSLGEEDRAEIRRSIEEAMRELREAMAQLHEKLREQKWEIDQEVGETLRLRNEQIRRQLDQMREELRRRQPEPGTARARTVYDI